MMMRIPLIAAAIAQLSAVATAHSQAAGDFSCAAQPDGVGACFVNDAARIGRGDGASAESCCASCKDQAGCAAWTWFRGSYCDLFSDAGPLSDHDATCISGNGGEDQPVSGGASWKCQLALKASECNPAKGCYQCVEGHSAALKAAGCTAKDEHKFCTADPQSWTCKNPQPDGSCIHSQPTAAQFAFAQKAIPMGPACKDCPNIVFSLTDDQDIALGGWNPMKKTQELLQKKGGLLTNWRIHTPICSPSRSETVSGRYMHNIKSPLPVPPIKLQPAASGHIDGSIYQNDSFGAHLRREKGYNVAMFGKSNFNTAEGFSRWFQGAFLGYGGGWQDNEAANFSYRGKPTDYATSLLGNKTLEWLNRPEITGAANGGRPFFVYFAPHCPHTPAYPADWYRDECAGVTSPRLPNYNYTDPGFHELVARQPPLTADDEILIDDLARRRCQCLMSVDDAHAAIVETLKAVGAYKKTYFLVSSDHGYNLGHHRIPSNKFLLYDHATRIPGVIAGPGIKPGGYPVLGTNVDYAPTWLAMAGIPTPPTMDGRSILTQLIPEGMEALLPAPTRAQLQKDRASLTARPWRTEQFHEYYNQGGPSPMHPQQCAQTDQFRPCEGWSPGSSTNPTQTRGDLPTQKAPIAFPRDVGLKATVRPLDDYSNTYIGLHSLDPAIGNGHYKYGEYQYECTTAQIAAFDCFSDVDMYQLFDLTADPYELHNVYNVTSKEIKDALAKKLREYYPCKGVECP